MFQFLSWILFGLCRRVSIEPIQQISTDFEEGNILCPSGYDTRKLNVGLVFRKTNKRHLDNEYNFRKYNEPKNVDLVKYLTKERIKDNNVRFSESFYINNVNYQTDNLNIQDDQAEIHFVPYSALYTNKPDQYQFGQDGFSNLNPILQDSSKIAQYYYPIRGKTHIYIPRDLFMKANINQNKQVFIINKNPHSIRQRNLKKLETDKLIINKMINNKNNNNISNLFSKTNNSNLYRNNGMINKTVINQKNIYDIMLNELKKIKNERQIMYLRPISSVFGKNEIFAIPIKRRTNVDKEVELLISLPIMDRIPTTKNRRNDINIHQGSILPRKPRPHHRNRKFRTRQRLNFLKNTKNYFMTTPNYEPEIITTNYQKKNKEGMLLSNINLLTNPNISQAIFGPTQLTPPKITISKLIQKPNLSSIPNNQFQNEFKPVHEPASDPSKLHHHNIMAALGTDNFEILPQIDQNTGQSNRTNQIRHQKLQNNINQNTPQHEDHSKFRAIFNENTHIKKPVLANQFSNSLHPTTEIPQNYPENRYKNHRYNAKISPPINFDSYYQVYNPLKLLQNELYLKDFYTNNQRAMDYNTKEGINTTEMYTEHEFSNQNNPQETKQKFIQQINNLETIKRRNMNKFNHPRYMINNNSRFYMKPKVSHPTYSPMPYPFIKKGQRRTHRRPFHRTETTIIVTEPNRLHFILYHK